jgi:hypothetical protein
VSDFLWGNRRVNQTLGEIKNDPKTGRSRRTCRGRGFYVSVVLEPSPHFSFFFCGEQIETMTPRRRERPMPDPIVEREMRELRARLDVMETTQRHTVDARDVNEAERENEAGAEEEVAVEDTAKECLFRVVARIEALEGNLDVEELLDWFRAMDKYFDYEDVEEDKKVKHVVTRLKGHVALWWDELQADMHCKGKQRIKNWDRMVAKMKAKFIPRDYQINLF